MSGWQFDPANLALQASSLIIDVDGQPPQVSREEAQIVAEVILREIGNPDQASPEAVVGAIRRTFEAVLRGENSLNLGPQKVVSILAALESQVRQAAVVSSEDAEPTPTPTRSPEVWDEYRRILAGGQTVPVQFQIPLHPTAEQSADVIFGEVTVTTFLDTTRKYLGGQLASDVEARARGYFHELHFKESGSNKSELEILRGEIDLARFRAQRLLDASGVRPIDPQAVSELSDHLIFLHALNECVAFGSLHDDLAVLLSLFREVADAQEKYSPPPPVDAALIRSSRAVSGEMVPSAVAVDDRQPVLLEEPSLANMEVELPAPVPPSLLERVKSHLFPTASTAHLPRIEDLITITEEDGAIVFTARDYDPAREGEQSWRTLLDGGLFTYRLTTDAVKLLIAGDKEGFDHLTKVYGAGLIAGSGMKLKVRGLEKLKPGEIYYDAPTHNSAAEYAVLFLALDSLRIGFLAKEEFAISPQQWISEFFKNPLRWLKDLPKRNPVLYYLLGRAMAQMPDRIFFINREDKNSAGGIVGVVAKKMAKPENGTSLVWYAQGTRADIRFDENGLRVEGDLFAKGPLKRGLGQVAVKTLDEGRNVPVLPIVINGLGIVQPKGIHAVQRNETVEIVIGDPIDPAGLAPLTGEAAATEITRRVEDFFRANYQAPLSAPIKNERVVDSKVQSTEKTELAKAKKRGVGSLVSKMSHGVFGALTAPLSSAMYSPTERARLAFYYLQPKFRALSTLFGQIGPFTENNPLFSVRRDDSYWKAMGKRFASGLGRLLRTLGQKPYSLPRPAVAELIPPEARLDPITREAVVSIMSAIINRGPVVELPAVLAERIDQAYGDVPEVAQRFKEYALGYLRFIAEDTEKAMALYQKDESVDDAKVRAARGKALEAFDAVRFRGEPMNEWVFAVIREQAESRKILEPEGRSDRLSFSQLQKAEQALGDLVARGPAEGQSKAEYQKALSEARERVRIAFDRYASSEGLAAGSRTFTHLHLYGRAIPHHYLTYALGAFDVLRNDPQIERLLALHQRLMADPKGGAVDTEFEQAMRRFLDTPGYARTLQAGLMHVGAAMNALLKNPTTFMWEVFEMAGQVFGLHSPEAKAYSGAMDKYLSVKKEHEATESPRRELSIRFQQAREEVMESAWDLLRSSDGAALITRTFDYLAHPEVKSKLTGVHAALTAHARHQSARRSWASNQQAKNEALLPEIIQYATWRDGEMSRMIVDEARLILDAAKEMMAQALGSHEAQNNQIVRSLLQETIDQFRLSSLPKAQREKAVKQGLTPLDDISVVTEFTENAEALFTTIARRVGHQAEHLQRVADPTKVYEYVDRNKHGEVPTGHSVSFNRAVEDLHVAAGRAYHAASKALRLVRNDATPIQPVSLTATALHAKIAPTFDGVAHRADGNHLIEFLADVTGTRLLEGMWALERGLPADHYDSLIHDWAQAGAFGFHQVKVDDRRHQRHLPGQVDLADLGHNGGWYIDYNTAQALAPKEETVVLIAKNGLDSLLPPGMGEGLKFIARQLPDEGNQSALEGAVLGTLIAGFSDRFVRPGAQNTTFFGALTMGVAENPDPASLIDPSHVLSDSFVTGLDLRGIGRGTSLAYGAEAVLGTSAGVRPVISANYGGHGVGPKPDSPIRVYPREMHATVAEQDPLTLPRGDSLLDAGETVPLFTSLNAGEMITWWQRQQMTLEASARRLQSQGFAGAPTPKPETNGGNSNSGGGSSRGSSSRPPVEPDDFDVFGEENADSDEPASQAAPVAEEPAQPVFNIIEAAEPVVNTLTVDFDITGASELVATTPAPEEMSPQSPSSGGLTDSAGFFGAPGTGSAARPMTTSLLVRAARL